MEYVHVPVMLKEAVEYLNLKPDQIVVDCTLGGGGYAREIAKLVGEKGKIIAIDADKLAIKNAEILNAKYNILNTILINDNFKNLQKIVKEAGVEKVAGVVFDLGLSSAQLEDRSRGFSFRLDAPLDMNYAGPVALGVAGEVRSKKFEVRNSVDAENIVNKWKQEDLEKIIREYGEERYAGRIASAIIKLRPVNTTKKLAEIIVKSVPPHYENGRIHPATRTFQALRIATNNELENLEKALPQAVDILLPKGRLVVISYHSLEDRIVKNFFRREAAGCVCPPEIPICQCGHKPRVNIITKKVVRPSEYEVQNNSRARSAKLRCIEKL
ncbi:16S rRNA (cytosine(1402)-N(4))-methyltransferase [Candidatus Falkowbacteria bacterium CG10_big_fil_rev_8_21_14_0_10_43_10]|uniref:Ribosomal RNA small subunit methyltransferase H n=1 Tax=Candidatus Falkowbacteria bacterium CG10_big_fil_rev_8_21_14_0_10_43_10 TaxID=1974567 RepID=A0A2H0V2Y6_9BACT|nr:MAG: 16S rRNA (cytosine(1402)-N(4))-methyltransferase [Candidatus Falkowbacteria bacterium CG10_big_fil_rev_8_21_14_0_10_43_10]